MQKAAGFIVKYRYLILALMLILCIVCAILIPRVYINADMSKYLPDDSNMKQGVDLMNQEFPETALQNTIRVMFTDLPDQEIPDIQTRLAEIPNVTGVDYEPDSQAYQRDDHTLFILSTEYDYNSAEENAIESAVLEEFSDYTVTVKNDSANTGRLPLWIVVLAIALAMVILCIMCKSWAEPFLFLVTLGIGVVLNMGTNIFLGSISVTTFSIAAILQLVLSMDYSIILMNRYRQERALTNDRPAAMTVALKNAFSSISSSGLTTVVGLLMLVFMRFKIGFDIGVVLAKGVLLGMLCVLTILPCLILQFEGLITKTAKKELQVPTGKLAGFGYRFRRPLAIFFVLLFAGSYFLKGLTKTTYSLYMEDPIAEIFPKTNPIVMLYPNDDEDAAVTAAEQLEQTEGVDSVLSYGTTLGKPYTVQQMADTIETLGVDTALEPELLRILYYNAHKKGELPAIPASDFLHFVADDVAGNAAFSDYLDPDLQDQIAQMEQFAEPSALTCSRTSQDMAAFLDLDAGDLQQLYLYYFLQHGGVDTGTMGVSDFANFVLNEVAADPAYQSMFDAAALAQLQQLAAFTDTAAVTRPMTYTQLANRLGIDASQMYLLFVYYQAQNPSYQPGAMTLPAFAAFVQNNVANNPAFSGMIDQATAAQLQMLTTFTDSTTIQTPMDSAQLAGLLGMDAGTVEQILCLYYGAGNPAAMTLPEFTGFLLNTVLADPAYAGAFDTATQAQIANLHQMFAAAASGRQFGSGELASLLGLDAGVCQQIFYLYYSGMDVSGCTMTVNGFLGYVLGNPTIRGSLDAAALAQLQKLYELTTLAESGQVLDAAALSAVTQINTAAIEGIFAMQSQATGQPVTGMTLPAFLALITSDPYAALIPPAQLAQLQTVNQLVQAAASGAALTPAQLAAVTGIDAATVNQVFVLYYSAQQTMTLPEFTGFLTGTVLQDPNYAAMLTPAQQAQLVSLHQMLTAAAGGASFPPDQMAQLLGLDAAQTQLIYQWYTGSQIPGKTMTPLQLVEYLLTSQSANLDTATVQQLQLLQTLMESSLSGASYTVSQMAQLLGLDQVTVRLLYTYYASLYAINGWTMSLHTLVDFLLGSQQISAMLPGTQVQQLQLAQTLIHAAVNGTRYSPAGMARLLGMDADQATALYLLYISRHGDTSTWQISVEGLVDFLIAEVLPNETLSASLDADTASRLPGLQRLIDAVVSGDACSSAQMYTLLTGLTDQLEEPTVELLYLYYGSQHNADPAWTMSIQQLFDHLYDEVLPDPRFAGIIDDGMRTRIRELDAQLEESVAQMRGENYSLMLLTTSLPIESEQTSAFVAELHDIGAAEFGGDYYLIGDSAMNYEMEQSFHQEMLLITILTALAIFLVVAFTFRSVAIPLMLVLLVQCGVFLTVGFSGVLGYSMHYLAMLIVQCILMGATIDYGILFTHYYREHRRTEDIRQALVSAYAGSTHTIMTSGLVIILVTAVIAISPADETIAQICQTISVGALMACLLILFLLPGMLAALDRLVTKKKDRKDPT